MRTRHFYLSAIGLYFSFLNVSFAQFQHNGSAGKMGDSCYVFQWNANFKRGSIWKLEQISFRESFDLNIRVMLGCSNSEGDGMVFGFQSLGTFLGNYNGHLGYAGLAPSFGIELDTHQDLQHEDPPYDHLAVVADGVLNHHLLTDFPPPVRMLEGTDDIEDCLFHDFRVSWDVESNLLKVYFDCQLRITLNLLDLGILSGFSDVFWGATAGTNDENVRLILCPDFITEVDLVDDYHICADQEIALRAPFSGIVYAWKPGETLSDSTIRNPIANPTKTTIYQVRITDSCGLTFSEEILVNVADPPLVEVGFEDTVLCVGEGLSIDLFQPNATFSWSHGPNDSHIEIQTPGLYHVTVTSGACASTDSFRVSLVTDNQMVSLGGDTILCEGESLLLRPSLPGKYQWQDGSENSEYLVQEPGVYIVQIENRCGHFSSFREVSYEDCRPLYFPTGFTPNGDGVNDTFLPLTYRSDVHILEFSIFDRWGNLVYSIKNIHAREIIGWDGTMNGKQSPGGVYTYRVSESMGRNDTNTYWGNVTLIR